MIKIINVNVGHMYPIPAESGVGKRALADKVHYGT